MACTQTGSSQALGFIKRFVIRILLSKKYFRVTDICTQATKLQENFTVQSY